MQRWITVLPNDPQYKRLLEGTFSTDCRALPRRSLNATALREEATFEIVPLEEIERPQALAIALHSLRPATLILSLGPLLTVIVYLRWLGRPLDALFTGVALLGVLLFHASVNLLNDYADHMSGADRVSSIGGSRAIQRGWARAATFKIAGSVLLTAAIACGATLAVVRPLALVPVGFCSLGAAYYLTWGKAHSRRMVGLRETAIFCLGGPLLTIGFATAVMRAGWMGALAGQETWNFWRSTFALGCAFGFSALLYSALGDFESIMRDSLLRTPTLAVRLGFDRAKRFVAWSAGLSTVAIVFFAIGSGALSWLIPLILLNAATAFACTRRAMAVASPLSSVLRGLRNRGLWVHWVTTIAAIGGLIAAEFFS